MCLCVCLPLCGCVYQMLSVCVCVLHIWKPLPVCYTCFYLHCMRVFLTLTSTFLVLFVLVCLPFFHPPICPFVHLSICLSVCLSHRRRPIRLNKLLPANAPLSTLRVITASNHPLQVFLKGEDNVSTDQWREYIKPLSSVIRLGRAGAATDHSSVLFDVDLATGVIGEGRSNAHW
jgi:hypothetical protein